MAILPFSILMKSIEARKMFVTGLGKLLSAQKWIRSFKSIKFLIKSNLDTLNPHKLL